MTRGAGKISKGSGESKGLGKSNGWDEQQEDE